MTIKEAIILSLEDIKELSTSTEVCSHLIEKKYCIFTGKTPYDTVSAQLGDFIRNGDTRVSRIKHSGGTFLYYLTKYEDELLGKQQNIFENEIITANEKQKNYDERDLHILLSTFLKNTNISSKTIFHEQSKGKDKNQIWIHPDMIGVEFLKMHSKASRSLLMAINKSDAFIVSSYELKKEINSDNDLKQAYFQAVSNSSWANYGYLVALNISGNLMDEMERLNQSFGIGIIQLSAINPFQSKILFHPKYHNLDFKTIDKLCLNNDGFQTFISQLEKLMAADERYYNAVEKELEELCDKYFPTNSETDIANYCKKLRIISE